MKINIGLLLLAFGAIAVSIYATTGSGEEKPALAQLKPDFLPEYVRSSRLSFFLHDSNPLELSATQQANIETLLENHQSVMKPLLRRITLARKQFISRYAPEHMTKQPSEKPGTAWLAS